MCRRRFAAMEPLRRWTDSQIDREDVMADPDTNKTQQAVDKTARTADQTADAARVTTDAGAEATQQGAERLQGQMSGMLDMTSRVSQEAARRTSENLELMKRLAETMGS